MKLPCKNCLTLAICIGVIENLKNEYIKEGKIIDNKVCHFEDSISFDFDVRERLINRCELFKEYFPYDSILDCITPSSFDYAITIEVWDVRASKIEIFFKKYYPEEI